MKADLVADHDTHGRALSHTKRHSINSRNLYKPALQAIPLPSLTSRFHTSIAYDVSCKNQYKFEVHVAATSPHDIHITPTSANHCLREDRPTKNRDTRKVTGRSEDNEANGPRWNCLWPHIVIGTRPCKKVSDCVHVKHLSTSFAGDSLVPRKGVTSK